MLEGRFCQECKRLSYPEKMTFTRKLLMLNPSSNLNIIYWLTGLFQGKILLLFLAAVFSLKIEFKEKTLAKVSIMAWGLNFEIDAIESVRLLWWPITIMLIFICKS